MVAALAKGYSGLGAGKNNPELQCADKIGPIPRGWYTIGASTDNPAPVTLPLTPDTANTMCGRSNFLIHADNVQLPGWASEGCIIFDLTARQRIVSSHVARLEVIA